MVHQQLKSNFYFFYGRGGEFKSGGERTDYVSPKKGQTETLAISLISKDV